MSAARTEGVNTTMISKAAEDRRESARRRTGEFGTQTHADPGIVDAPEQFDGQRSRDVFGTPSVAAAASFAAQSEKAGDLREWDNGHLLNPGVSDYAIDMAFAKYHPQTEANKLAWNGRDPWSVLKAADQRFALVTTEAARVQKAWNAIAGQSSHPGPHLTVGQKFDPNQYDAAVIARNIRGDLKPATDAGLFPDGTSFGVTIDKYSGGQGGFERSSQRC